MKVEIPFEKILPKLNRVFSIGLSTASLEARGYPFERTVSGKPRVLRAFVEKRLGLASVEPLSHTEPDFSYWKQSKAA